MNTKLLHRLAWKEVRTLRALWLTLFVTAVVLQLGLVWVFDAQHAVANGVAYHPRQSWLFGVLLALPAIFAVAALAMSFAGEREEGTDQFLCRLAAPPLRLLGVKVGLCIASTVVMFVLLLVLTMLIALLVVPRDLYHVAMDPLDPQAQGTFVSRLARTHPEITVVFLDLRDDSRRALEVCSWMLNVLSCGVFFSLLFRRVFSSLIATAVAAWLLPRIVLALLTFNLGTQGPAVSWLEWLIHLGVIPGVLLLASAWLVQTWDEDRWPRFVERLLEAWRRVTATSERLADSSAERVSGGWRAVVRPFGLCLPDEWLPAWRRETRRLLWLEWRQARRVMLFVLAAFGVYAVCQGLFVAWGSVLVAKEFPFVMALVSFVFGAWSFQAQQSGQRFRDFAGHGASPAAMWFIKQGVWFAVTLLTVAMLTPFTAWLSGGRHFVYWEHERLWRTLGYGLNCGELTHWFRDPKLLSESLGGVVSNVVLAVGLCFGVGQSVSLLMARAVTVATVGFVLAGLAFGWQQFTALAAIPSELAVLPLIVGLLLASAVRMTDWLEQRNSVRGWLRVIAAFVVPSLVTLIGVPIYRVVEVPPILSAEFDFLSAEIDWQDLKSLNAVTGNVSPDAKQTAGRWIRLAESLHDEPIFLRKVSVEKSDANAPEEEDREMTPHDLWEFHLEFVAWAKLKNRDWLSHHADDVREAARIAEQPDCAFDPEIFESSDHQANFRFKRLSQLAVLLKMAAEAAIADGKLDVGLQHLLVLLRLSEHMQQHARWDAVQSAERLEVGTWSFLLRWGRHPAQTGDSLRAALGRTANAVSHPLLEALKKRLEMLPPPSQVVAEEYLATKQDIARHWRDVGWPASWLFWERQREERLLDYSAVVAIEQMHQWLRDSPENWQGDQRLVTRSLAEYRPYSRNRTLAFFLQGSTWNPNPSHHQPFVWSASSEWQRAKERSEAAAWRRGLIATLALRAFQLDHGRWPMQWDELIGPYLDSVPVDPWNGLPFELRPQGYPFEIKILGSRIPAHTPLFVSSGPNDQRLQPVVRTPTKGETSPTTDWVLTSPFGTQTWPPPEHGVSLSLIAFPLSATEP
jgi:hypothetical protein